LPWFASFSIITEMAYGAVCKKIKTPYIKTLVTKKIIGAGTLMPRANKKSYLLFSSEVAPWFQDGRRFFRVKEYFKKEMLKDLIVLLGHNKVKEIILTKELLEKMKIDVKSKQITDMENSFYSMGDFYFPEHIELVDLQKSINILEPTNKDLFENFREIYDIRKSCNNNENFNACTLAISSVIFFIDQFHSLFKDLLSRNEKVRVVLGEIPLLLFEDMCSVVFHDFQEMYEEHLKKFMIFESEDKYIIVTDKAKEFTNIFIQKVLEQQGYQIEPNPVWGRNTYFLRNVAIYAFLIYILSYIHLLIDFRKLNRDMLIYKIAEMKAKYDVNNGELQLTIPWSNINIEIKKDLLAEGILVNKILKNEETIGDIDYFIVTKDGQQIYQPLPVVLPMEEDFIETLSKTLKTNSWFVVTKSGDDHKIHMPYSLDSFVFFFKTITNSEMMLDSIIYRSAVFLYRLLFVYLV
jgi:hypothetical protein